MLSLIYRPCAIAHFTDVQAPLLCHLGKGFGEETKIPFYASNLSLIQAFGGHGVVFPEWKNYISKIFSNDPLIPPKPSDKMTVVARRWFSHSDFVLNGGKKKLNIDGVDVTVKNISSFVSLVNPRVYKQAVIPSQKGNFLLFLSFLLPSCLFIYVSLLFFASYLLG